MEKHVCQGMELLKAGWHELPLFFSKLLNHNYGNKQTSLSEIYLKNKVLNYLFHLLFL